MSTGYHAAVSADVQPGDTVAVVGDGAVGLSGVLSAKMLGAERIIVLGSTHEDRHQLAREWGATDIISVRGDEAIKAAARPDRRLRRRRGAGVRRHQGLDGDRLRRCKAGAIVGRVGVPHGVDIDAEGTFYRNVGMRGGPAPARHYQPELLRQCSTVRSTRARSST